MIPDFKVTADDVDITEVLNKRLVSLTVTDELGLISDSLEIVLDNRDHSIELPSRGAVLSVYLGYKESGILPMGKFVVDEVEISFPACQMHLVCRSSDSFEKEAMSGIKALKSRSWHEQTYAEIIRAIAEEHNLKIIIDAAFGELLAEHIDQTEESDIAFLNRILGEVEGFVKVANGVVIAGILGSGKSPSGEPLPEIRYQPGNIAEWRVRIAERGKFGRCDARYHNKKTGRQEKVFFGAGDPSFCLPYIYASKETAKKAAAAKFKEMERGICSLELTGTGNPEILAESVINLTGVSNTVDGKWLVGSCAHELSDSGYTTRINATRKEE